MCVCLKRAFLSSCVRLGVSYCLIKDLNKSKDYNNIFRKFLEVNKVKDQLFCCN